MRRITESAVGVVLLAATFILALAGLITELVEVSVPPVYFGGAVILAIAAIAVAVDEHRRTASPEEGWREALFGRLMVALSILIGIVAFVLGLQSNDDRNLWLLLAVIVGLDGLAIVVDLRRIVVAEAGMVATRDMRDAVLGVIAGAVALGCGGFGFVSGLFGYTHAPAWQYAGVILALLANVLMFDEQAHVAAAVRRRRSGPALKKE